MDTLAIIKRIEMRITELGMAKADFYKKSGISSASYSQWNTGLYRPSEKKLRSAAECLGVSYEYIRYGSEAENKKAPTPKDARKDVLDDVDVAFYGEYKELDEEQKATIRDMVAVMRSRKEKRS